MIEATSPSTLVIPQLIVGLGNPEPKYDKTRHNIGFDAVDALARRAQISWSRKSPVPGIVGGRARKQGRQATFA
jgi:PTH1 family peptidyl-tRNA hydrolase